MKITYRPHRGGYDEAMSLVREYDDILDMLRSVAREYDNEFSVSDISIRYYGHDSRNGWDTFIVSTHYIGGQRYETPVPIGWCHFGELPGNQLISLSNKAKLFWRSNKSKIIAVIVGIAIGVLIYAAYEFLFPDAGFIL